MEDQEEQLVQQGEAAEMLLDSDAFSSTINQLVDASFRHSVTPHHSKQRSGKLHITITAHLWTSSRRYVSASK